MNRWAVIYNDEVVNVIIWNGEDPIPTEWNLLPNDDGQLQIGMELVSGEWQYQKWQENNLEEQNLNI